MKTFYLKLTLLLAFSFFAFTSFAQINFGLKGGLNLADLTYISNDPNTGKAKALGSFQLGAVIDYPLTWWISLQPGLMVTGKGANVKQKELTGTFTHKIHPWYLEVPVNLLFKPSIDYNTQLYFGGGPYLAFGIGGKSSYDGTSSLSSYISDHKLKFGNGQNADMRRIDLGMNILAGVEFRQVLMIGVQYGFSLRNNAPKKNDETPDVLKNKGLSISLTLLFGPKYNPYYY